MYRYSINLLTVFMLFAGGLLLSACNAEPEQSEMMEDAIEDAEGPIEEEMQQEFGLYDTWDADRDARLTSTEFRDGYGTGTYWSDWDTDGDTYLSEDEYNTAYSNYSWYTPTLYGDWDVNDDNLLDENEWNDGLFNTWDADDDTYLTREEYDMNDGLFDTM
jgi:hypothetical protein